MITHRKSLVIDTSIEELITVLDLLCVKQSNLFWSLINIRNTGLILTITL